jgi:hypothetical protein
MDELIAAGIVDGGELHPVARQILSPVASPEVVVSVEISGSTFIEIATIWRRGPRATVGSSRDRATFDLHPVEPGLLAFHLAALTGVRIRKTVNQGPLAVDRSALAAAVPLADADRDAAKTILRTSGVAEEDAALILDLHGPPLRRWRISTLWSEPDGFVGDRALEMIDAGTLGYWEITAVPEDGRVEFTQRSPDSALRLLAKTLPSDI